MFILSKKLWVSDHIIKLHCTLDWDAPDTNVITNCILDEIKQLLIEAKKDGKPAYIICDCTKGELPPFMTALFVAKFMSGIEHILEGGLHCSIIYTKSEVHKMWFDKIFDLYKPKRPVYMVANKEDIRQYIVS
jgi:hypothetical protein